MVSGYIIARISLHESVLQFCVKRFFRIFPLLFAVVTVAFLSKEVSRTSNVGLQDLVSNSLLLNYFQTPQIVLVGVAWSLVVEVLFYALTILAYPLNKSLFSGLWFPLFLLSISVVMIFSSRMLGSSYFLLSVNFTYIPILTFGVLFAMLEKGRVSNIQAAVIAAICWFVFLYGTNNFYPNFLQLNSSYPISVAFGVAFFATIWILRSRVKGHRWIAVIALTSYSIYLLHELVGLKVIELLNHKLGFPYTVSLVFGLVSTASAVFVTFNLIEKPGQRIGAYLSNRFR